MTREHKAPLEQAACAMAAARLMQQPSKRATLRGWLGALYRPAFEGLSLQWLHRAMDVPTQEQSGSKGGFERTQELFSPSLVLADTLSTCLQGPTRGSRPRFGKSERGVSTAAWFLEASDPDRGLGRCASL